MFNKVCQAIAAGNSVLVLGEAGTGKGNFALNLHEEMSGEFNSAIATYKGSIKKFFVAIAMQLDCPTEDERARPLTVDALKEEILVNCGEDTLLIFPEAKRLTTSIRYWLEDLLSNGVKIVCFAVANPGRDIFLEMLEIELELPSDRSIREVMEAEAQRQGLEISKSKLAELQPLAGRNPMLARKIIRNEKLGLKQDKPEHLLGNGILPEHLNDYKIGRVMDKLYDYGLSKLFLLIALAAAKKYQISLDFSHLDSSSFSVHGEYNQGSCSEDKQTKQESDEDSEIIPITITHGYSRDHRPDLKQFILDLIVTGDGNIPVFIEAASGNQSDKKAFGQIAKNYKKKLKLDTTIVGDSALYSKDNLGLLREIKWLTRVPLSIKEAKNLVHEVSSSEFSKSELPGYSFVEKTSNYGGIPQRWLVVESEARAESARQSLEKKITKEKEIVQKKVAKLFKKTFENATEAELSLKQIQSKLKYHLISEIEIIENQVKPLNKTYQITGKIEPNHEVIESYQNRAGRFIIATNRLDNESFSCDEMLRKYKEQQNVERGFAFLKDPLFFADSIFLKSPRRIETMAMLMGLCLMVYSLGQREVRYQLCQAKTGIPNQLGKLTARPTLRWIFQCFQGIHLLIHQGIQQVVNLTEERLFTLKFFPLSCQKYYILSG